MSIERFSSLYALTVDAAEMLELHGINVDLKEWIAAINPVLAAAGQQLIGEGVVESVVISEKQVRIRYTYTVRFFYDEASVRNVELVLPEWVVMSENSVRAARIWYLQENINEMCVGILDIERDLDIKKNRLNELVALLNEALNAG